MKLKSPLLVLCFLPCFLTAQTFHPGDTLHVFAHDGLKLRDRADINGTEVAKAAFGETVVVINGPEKEAEVEKYDRFPGKWIAVKYKNQSAYAFSGYLSPLPVPVLSGNPRACLHGFIGALNEYAYSGFILASAPDTSYVFKTNGKPAETNIKQVFSDSSVLIRHEFHVASKKNHNAEGLASELILPKTKWHEVYQLLCGIMDNCTSGPYFLKSAHFDTNDKGEIEEITVENQYNELTCSIRINRNKTISLWCYYTDH